MPTDNKSGPPQKKSFSFYPWDPKEPNRVEEQQGEEGTGPTGAGFMDKQLLSAASVDGILRRVR